MSLTTLIFDPEQAHTAALAEEANRNAEIRTTGTGHGGPIVDVAGVQTSTWIDPFGIAHVKVVTVEAGDGPFGLEGEGIPFVLELDDYRLWDGGEHDPAPMQRVRELVTATMQRTADNVGDVATWLDFTNDLVNDLVMELPMSYPLRRAMEAERGNKPYTVFGVIDAGGQLDIAAVLEGEHKAIDTVPPGSTSAERWSTVVFAYNPASAEHAAREEFSRVD